MRRPSHTDADQRRRLREGPSPGEFPGALGLLPVHIAAPDPSVVLEAARAAMDAHLGGERWDPDLDFDADWGLWSLSLADGGLTLTLVVFGFPVSGFSGLRRFFVRLGASSVTQGAQHPGR